MINGFFKLFIIKTFLLCSLLIVHCTLKSQVPPPSPMDAFAELTIQMHKIDSVTDLKWDRTEYCRTIYSAELFTASSNEGKLLLNYDSQDKLISTLDEFQLVGIRGVSLTINYPILVNSFSDYSNYLNFYINTVNEIRNRNIKILVNCNISQTDTVICKLKVKDFYTDLTLERYRNEKAQMLNTILEELQPDYLTVEEEPTGFFYSTGLKLSVDEFANNVNFFLNNTIKNQTLIGAGTGSWEDIKYTENIAGLNSLDYIDMHIFPVYFDFVTKNVFKIDSVAKANNKMIIIGSSWAYKTNGLEFNTDSMKSTQEYISRNSFNTYIPIDSSFIKNIYKLSNVFKSDFTSFYWSQAFAGYIKYDKAVYEKMSPFNILKRFSDSTFQNIQQLNISENGELFNMMNKSFCNPDVINKNFEVNDWSDINLYPNPTSDYINIDFSRIDLKAINVMSFKIYDIQGSLVKESEMPNLNNSLNTLRIETKGLNNGLYIIKVQNSNNIYNKKILLQN